MDTTEKKTLEEIIREQFDLSGLDAEKQKEVIGQTAEMITETALLRTIEESSDESKKAFDVFMDTNPEPEDMFQFLKINMPAFEKILSEEMQLFATMDLDKQEEQSSDEPKKAA